MSNPEAPLEEILWRSPPHVQMMGGYLHSNNILFYFAESPFFDATSNNASLAIQASYNDAFRHFVETREAFEGRLKTMQGLEFIVAYDPLQAAAQSERDFAHEPANIWVIRKQSRRHRGSGLEDEVVVLATFFVVGDCIYMAPCVGSVVGHRILSAVTSLTRMLKTASSLPNFTASHGHTYLPPVPRESQGAQQAGKEDTPMPEEGQTKGAVGPQQGASTGTMVQDARNLAESFGLLNRYGDEYMDETPLVGEPGSFILSRSGDADRASGSGHGPGPGASAKQPPTSNAPPTRAGTPQVRVDTPGKASSKGSTPPSSDETKTKRRKSRLVD